MPHHLFVVPHLRYSGTTSQVFTLVDGLSRAGHRVDVVSLQNTGPRQLDFERAGATVHLVGVSGRWEFSGVFSLRTLIKSLDPDLVHLSGLPVVRCYRTVFPKSRWPFVVSGVAPRTDREPIALVDRWLLHGAARIFVRTPGEKARCVNSGLPVGQVECVGLAPTPEVWFSPNENDRCEPKAGFSICCIGPITPEKGFLEAAWSFDLLGILHKEVHLEFVGSGSFTSRLSEFRSCVLKPDRISITGNVPNIRESLRCAGVVWVPSLQECGLQVMVEAMALGRPVVVSDRLGGSGLIQDGRTGYVVPAGDKVKLARATKRLIDDPELREAMGDAAKISARQNASPDSLVARYADLTEKAA
ncbi:MAG: glycosyltransferase family 4 protein [Gemmataceae bacterium]